MLTSALVAAMVMPGQTPNYQAILDAHTLSLKNCTTMVGKAESAPEDNNQFSVEFKMKKPMMALYNIKAEQSRGVPGATKMMSDGKSMWMINVDKKSYVEMPADAGGMLPPGLEAFGPNDPQYKAGSGSEVNLGGRPTHMIDVSYTTRNTPLTSTFWFDRETKQLVRVKLTDTTIYTGLKFNEPLEDSLFTFVPGTEYKKEDFQMGGGDGDLDKTLLKVGSTAPNWSLKMPNGKTITLAQALKGKKALVLNFWFYG